MRHALVTVARVSRASHFGFASVDPATNVKQTYQCLALSRLYAEAGSRGEISVRRRLRPRPRLQGISCWRVRAGRKRQSARHRWGIPGPGDLGSVTRRSTRSEEHTSEL